MRTPSTQIQIKRDSESCEESGVLRTGPSDMVHPQTCSARFCLMLLGGTKHKRQSMGLLQSLWGISKWFIGSFPQGGVIFVG